MKTIAWLGILTATAACAFAVTPVDQCGTVLHPDTTQLPANCEIPLATQWDAAWALGLTGVVLLTAWQIINWRRHRT